MNELSLYARLTLAVALTTLAGFALHILGTAPAQARSLIAPPKVCPNQNGFSHRARAERSIICLTNYARHKKGLRRYKVRRSLNRSAKRKAADIVRCNQFSHQACGRKFTFWFARSGYSRTRRWGVAENIAWGGGRYGNSRRIFRAWMRSRGHRRAILSRTYRDLGVAVKPGRVRGFRNARVWVQHFGLRR